MSWNTNHNSSCFIIWLDFVFFPFSHYGFFSSMLVNENGCSVGCWNSNWNSGCLSLLVGAAMSVFRGTLLMLKHSERASRSCWRSLALGGVLAFEEWPLLCECVFKSRQLGEIASLCQETAFSLILLHLHCISPIVVSLTVSIPNDPSLFIIFSLYHSLYQLYSTYKISWHVHILVRLCQSIFEMMCAIIQDYKNFNVISIWFCQKYWKEI